MARGDRRVGQVILAAWRDGARFDGWNEHFSFKRWAAACSQALADEPVDLAWYTTRERDYDEVLPWDHLDSGLDRDWLWEDWQSAVAPSGAGEVEDCRVDPVLRVWRMLRDGYRDRGGADRGTAGPSRLLPVLSVTGPVASAGRDDA